MYLKKHGDRFYLFASITGIALLYLSLVWKTTGNVDQLTTESLFWGVILWLLWRSRETLNFHSDALSSLLGLFLLSLVISKTVTLFWFESILLPVFPFSATLALGLIASGIRGLKQYAQILFFSWFLFFPTGVIGHSLDNIIQITVLNAKFATYFLYYLGFDVASQGNQVLLSLPNLGAFKAIVDYPCAGVPMILLLLKLGLLFVSLVTLSVKQKVFIPLFSIGLGFLLGVIRVCILTLLIPDSAKFDYWHGAQGSQIFSTLAITIFAGFCYWILELQVTPATANN